MAFDIQPPKRKRSVSAKAMADKTPKASTEPGVVVESKKSKFKPKSVKEVKVVKKSKVQTQDFASVQKPKKIKKNKVETHSNASVKKSKPNKVKRVKASKQGSGFVMKFFISLIGVSIIVGGVVFIRQNQVDLNVPKKSDTKAGIVDKFSDELPASVIPVDENVDVEPSVAAGPEVELVEMHNNFIDKLNELDNQAAVLEVDHTDNGIVDNFDNYLNEF